MKPLASPLASPFRRLLASGFGVLALLLTAVTETATPARASASLNATTTASTGSPVQIVYRVVNPTSKASLLTTYSSEADAAAQHGFTEKSRLLTASSTAQPGLTGVHRLYRAGDFASEADPERKAALVRAGYTDQGVRFHASLTPAAGTQPVHRYGLGTRHRYVQSDAERQALAAAGWTYHGVSFHAAPADAAQPGDGDGKFTLAVFPDTQQEVLPWSNDQFAKRTRYVVDKAAAKDIRFVASVGDNANWGGNETEDPAPDQWKVLSDAYRTLDVAGLPYSVAAGNHDVALTCSGGKLCPSLVGNPVGRQAAFRDTRLLNRTFPLGTRVRADGSFDNRVENSYRTFSAEGRNWLLLNLEAAPRRSALDWAKNVVATHPRHNVIVVSHYLKSPDGTMDNMSYGSLSTAVVYDELINAYPNVKLALGGHIGQSYRFVTTGAAGNKVVTIISTFHANDYNPTRFITFDVNNNSFYSNVEAASIRADYLKTYPTATMANYSTYTYSETGLAFVRP